MGDLPGVVADQSSGALPSELTARAPDSNELVTRAELAWKPGQRNLYMLEECTFYILPDTYCC